MWFGPKTIGTLESNIPMVELGDGWQLHGKLTYEENYYGKEELKLTVSGSDKQCFRDERYDLPFPLSTLSSMRSYASEILSLGSEGKWLNASIVKTMVLGYGSDIPYKTRQIFRQSGDSFIAHNAKIINRGETNLYYGDDFQFIKCETQEQAAVLITDLYCDQIKHHGVERVQILSPYRTDGSTSVDKLNAYIRELVNPIKD